MSTRAKAADLATLSGRWTRICQDLTWGALEGMTGFGKNRGETAGAYQDHLAVVRRAVDDTLELERDCVSAWEEMQASTPYPLPLGATMLRAIIDGRANAWNAWFDAADKLLSGPEELTGPAEMLKVWQDMMKPAFSDTRPSIPSGESATARRNRPPAAGRASAAG